ncbi:ABC transporter ATP-binding protein/permease [Mycobacterium sp. NBC_00419]|uniref:ABC transporter ATP-binding protein n=1 Tax=Mycobacterium sp. NBC_00419 TaxID=2975989 RepID=UPI002E1B4F5C
MSDNRPVATRRGLELTRLQLLWSFASPHRGTLAGGTLLGLIGSAAGLATPMITKAVLDTLGSHASLVVPVASLIALLLLSATVRCWQAILLGSLGERVVLEARETMVNRMLRATVQAVTKRPAGELVTRVTSDSVLLHEAASSSVIGLINGFVMLVGTLVLMAVLDVPLLLATLGAIVVVSILFLVLMPGVADERQAAQQHLGRVGGTLEATLHAIRTVKASRAEQRQSDKIIESARVAAEHSIRAVRRESIAETIAWAGVDFAIIMILTVGAWRVGSGAMELSSLVAFLLYAFGLMDPVTELSTNVTTLQTGIAAAGRIREVQQLDTEPILDSGVRPAGGARIGQPALELRCVTAAYEGRRAAVHDVNLIVPERGHIAIVGPSGAGKTTVLSLIMQFLVPQSGELFFSGQPYSTVGHDHIRSRLAFVEQETPVLPGTVRENLLYRAGSATDQQLHRVLDEVRLADDIAALEHGLDTDLTSSAISTGQRQRIALARAIIKPSEVLVLDEATAHVDGLSEAAIHDCIRLRARVQAVVTVAHRLSTVVDADTIVVMQDGRIRARGTHAELLASDGLYRNLVAAMHIPTR